MIQVTTVFFSVVISVFTIACASMDQPANKSGSETISIASFNIKGLSRNKITDSRKAPYIIQTVAKFDIVAIQEIRDKTSFTMEMIESRLESLGKDYDFITGPLLPKGDQNYKERYAFIYNTATIQRLSEGFIYKDDNDDFEREPYYAHFKARHGTFDFVLVNIHTKPAKAEHEIIKLVEVIAATSVGLSEPDVIVAGDYNADCARNGEYFDETMEIKLRSDDYLWIIPNSADTNLAPTDCAYDRIVTTKSVSKDYAKKWGVYYFDKIFGLSYADAKMVSDHYPIWAEFYINMDGE